jgi:predicted dehydrogenase
LPRIAEGDVVDIGAAVVPGMIEPHDAAHARKRFRGWEDRMSFKTLIIGSGFGSRVVKGCYEEAGMEVEVITARDNGPAIREAISRPWNLVSVHSPPFMHAEHVNLALDHGHDVLCDKPFGVSSAEARQMLDRAREKGVIHILNFEFRDDPGRARVKQIIDSGEIGKVTHIHWKFFNAFCRYPPRKHNWQFDRDRAGGWVRINGTHMIDALRWLGGEVVEVDCRGRIDVKERPDKDGVMRATTAEDGFTAFMTLDSGASVVIDTAWGLPGSLPDNWTIIGTEGMIEVTERIELYIDPMVRDTEIKVLSGGRERSVEHIGPFAGDGHLPALRPFSKKVRKAIEERRQFEPSFAAGVAASEVVDRMHASMNAKGRF